MPAGSFFWRGYGTISRVADCFVGKGGLPKKTVLIRPHFWRDFL